MTYSLPTMRRARKLWLYYARYAPNLINSGRAHSPLRSQPLLLAASSRGVCLYRRLRGFLVALLYDGYFYSLIRTVWL